MRRLWRGLSKRRIDAWKLESMDRSLDYVVHFFDGVLFTVL
jgi:hypothetical protein